MIHVDPESHWTKVMEMERADDRGFEKLEAMQKWQINNLSATVKD